MLKNLWAFALGSPFVAGAVWLGSKNPAFLLWPLYAGIAAMIAWSVGWAILALVDQAKSE